MPSILDYFTGGGASLAGGIFSGISSLVNSKRNYKAQKYNAELQYKSALETTRLNNQAQMELAKYQNDYNTQMWDKQNKYNSPTAQMQRLKEAGLNPALMYTQGTTGQASAPQPAAVPDIDYSRMSSGPQRVARRFAELGDIFNQAVGVAKSMEEIRGMRLANDGAEIQNLHLEDYWRARNLLSFGKFYWSGGIPGSDVSSGIQKALYDKLRGQADFQMGNSKFLGARERLIEATINNLRSQTTATSNANWMFNKTTKPWVSDFGRWYGLFNSAGDLLKSAVGSFGSALGRGFGFKAFYH
nr:MAG: DNA pilot protein [Microvirus sp.]